MTFPEDIHRIALGLEYNGSKFQGFQRQSSAKRTVQGALEEGLSSVADEPLTVICAGRTDAGVHATQQVIHFDTSAVRPHKAWLEGVNSRLPDDVKVVWAKEVKPAFHARFSALSRTYRYIIYSSPQRPALMWDQVTWTKYVLDIEAMKDAATFLVGEHDFTSYRATQCQAQSPVRCIHSLKISRQAELICVEINANAFLHHMVRNIIGVLLEVGRGAQAPLWAKTVLDARDRRAGAATAKPHGLYFVAVEYPSELSVSLVPRGPFFIG